MRKIISSFAIISVVAGCSGSEETGFQESSKSAELKMPHYEVTPVAPIDEPGGEPLQDIPELAVEDEVASQADPPGSPQHFVAVRPGENLISLADWAGTTPTELAQLNGMEVQDTLYAGQRLGFELEGEGVDTFTEARENALDARVDRYLERRGGLYTVEAYSMRQGDTAWGIAQEKGAIPLWVLSAFNQDIELSSLSIGDSISLPVVEDTIQASAELTPGPEVEAEVLLENEGGSF